MEIFQKLVALTFPLMPSIVAPLASNKPLVLFNCSVFTWKAALTSKFCGVVNMILVPLIGVPLVPFAKICNAVPSILGTAEELVKSVPLVGKVTLVLPVKLNITG